MAFAEILLGGQTLASVPTNMGEYAIWGIGVWTVVNVAAVIAFHLGDPEARKRMALQGEKDAVFEEALTKLSTYRAKQSGQLSDQLATAMMEQLKAELAVDHNGDGIPDVMQGPNPLRQNQPGNGVPRRMAATTPPLPTETETAPYHVQFFNEDRAMWETKVSYPEFDTAQWRCVSWARESNHDEHYRVYYQGKEVYHSTSDKGAARGNAAPLA
jgi:hypothetical protein